MEIKKPNDILVATLNNPQATTYDLMTLNLNGMIIEEGISRLVN